VPSSSCVYANRPHDWLLHSPTPLRTRLGANSCCRIPGSAEGSGACGNSTRACPRSHCPPVYGYRRPQSPSSVACYRVRRTFHHATATGIHSGACNSVPHNPALIGSGSAPLASALVSSSRKPQVQPRNPHLLAPSRHRRVSNCSEAALCFVRSTSGPSSRVFDFRTAIINEAIVYA